MDLPAGRVVRALVAILGNAEHKFVPVLQNPVNDATAVAEILEKLNFDKVILKKDLGFDGFRAALRELSREAKGAEAAVVFFAGNGIEVDGRNYLIPRRCQAGKGRRHRSGGHPARDRLRAGRRGQVRARHPRRLQAQPLRGP